ncbi:hypothetical protein FSARC_1321 [Fusarium sarcochroum]|uniref:Ig-like domain-containing protein n=1 Tax=Fusarium sarcochroum TaxID=1208366 RepID=A0A8H4U8T1_9HYPO|nr:hypothetical protein FSARC_1321 [Fusarium sarcochroum]
MDQQQPITAEWCQKMDTRLKWLKHLGVMGKIDLHRGPDGLPCYDGMPLEHDTFLAPSTDTPAATTPTTTVAPASQSPSDSSIRISSDLFKGIMEDLQSRPAYTHVAWAIAVVKLQLMQETTPNALHVFNTLKPALEACKSDLNAVTTLLTTSCRLSFLTEEPQVTTWLAPLQCRLIGIQSEPSSSVTWWEDNGRTALRRFNDDNLYRCIDSTNRGFIQAYAAPHDLSLVGPASIAVAGGVLPNIRRFLQMQQNQDVLAKIEHHITRLHTDMQRVADEEEDVLF